MKGLALLALLIGAGSLVSLRLNLNAAEVTSERKADEARAIEASINRFAEAKWSARVRRVEGMAFPDNTQCVVYAWFRGDGKDHTRTDVTVSCGSLVLYPRTMNLACTIRERSEGAKHRYGLLCVNATVGRLSLSVDTEQKSAVLQQPLPAPFRIERDVDELSEERKGTAFFRENATKR